MSQIGTGRHHQEASAPMAQQAVYTETMTANAMQWLQSAQTWTRGVRKSDGLALVIFPSASKPGTGHYTTETACSCRGFQYRNVCSHVLAVRLEIRQAREEAVAAHERACAEAANGELVSIYA